MRCDLSRHFREIAEGLSRQDARGYPFSSGSFTDVPDHLETSLLVIKKGYHDYDGFRADVLSFVAQKQTYRQLGLLILAVIFRSGGARVHLELTNPESTVRHLLIKYPGLTNRGFQYRTRPDHFLFIPGEIAKHPWAYQDFHLFDLPAFKLTNLKEIVITEEDWAQRDTVVGFGNDDASVRLADLLLKFGSPSNETTEVFLEGEGGFRGVGRFSAEAAFCVDE